MLQVAIEFVDELIHLGSIEECPLDDPLITNPPLFVVPKTGKESIQWHVIADMKRGGQNSAIAKDPVYLPHVDTILPQMYSRGWSAVIDASKFFINSRRVCQNKKI